MQMRKGTIRLVLLAVALCAIVAAADFTWDWRNQEAIGRTDQSLGTTSKLNESERAALIDIIVARLRKPLTERGYDNDRIREIASTTRLRFVDVGEGKWAILATSLGLEGGCDVLANCPFWVFRLSDKGYVTMLEADAASYTVQPTATGGYSDLVLARHITPNENRLTLYKYANGKYADAGCYIATFSSAKGSDIQDPQISPCKDNGG
jgi:hypothetical protein